MTSRPGELPEGWAWSKLSDLAATEGRAITDGPFGSNLKSAHYTESGPRVIRLQNIGDGVFRDEEAHISEEHFSGLQRHSVQGGDLVVASLGETLPRACIVPPWVPPAIVKADCIRVRLHPEVSTRYVNFALQRGDLRDETATKIKGVGRPRLGMAGIRDLPVPLPPVAEQGRIVAAIEEHLSHIDAAAAAIERSRARIALLVESSIQTEVNRSAIETASLSEFLSQALSNGRSVPTAAAVGFPVLRLTCLRNGSIDLRETKVGEWGDHDPTRFLVESNDFLISRGSGSLHLVGRGGLVPDSPPAVAYPDTLIRARVDHTRLRPDFLALIWDSRVVRRQLEAQARTTAGIYKVNQSILERVQLPVPSLDVQDDIVRRATRARDAVDEVAAEVRRARGRSLALRRSILAAAFSGRLVAQDPSDEPAEVLLARIAEERSSVGTKGRTMVKSSTRSKESSRER